MVKLVLSNQKMVTLKRGNKTITRTELDYETNKGMYDFRGFKLDQDVVKEIKEVVTENVVPLKKKRKTRKKKDEQVDLETN
tara:strand:- start:247 stop:489 length:243 start_codon:yes stop_codon:yes gene_type:complete